MVHGGPGNIYYYLSTTTYLLHTYLLLLLLFTTTSTTATPGFPNQGNRGHYRHCWVRASMHRMHLIGLDFRSLASASSLMRCIAGLDAWTHLFEMHSNAGDVCRTRNKHVKLMAMGDIGIPWVQNTMAMTSCCFIEIALAVSVDTMLRHTCVPVTCP